MVAPVVWQQFERNSKRQPDYTTFDLCLSWTANLGRRIQLELIAGVFTLFDSSNWLTDEFEYNDDFGLNTLPG